MHEHDGLVGHCEGQPDVLLVEDHHHTGVLVDAAHVPITGTEPVLQLTALSTRVASRRMGVHRHTRRCFGCSEVTGRSLQIVRAPRDDGVGIEGRVWFGPEHMGAPGLVHGGLLATLADEVMGSVEHGGEGLRLTADMTVRFRRPAPVDTEFVCRARLGEVTGRRYTVVAEIVAADAPDTVVAEAEATYVLASGAEDG